MISAIVAALSFVAIIVTTSLLVVKGTDLKKQYDDRMRSMTDQINNANYYNAQVDKQNAQSIADVRKSYASKDDIARAVDTKELSASKANATDLRAGSLTGDVLKAGTSTADNLRANKFVSPGGVVGQLESSVLSAKRVNLVGDGTDAGISFDGDYLLQRGVEGESKNLVFNLPKGAHLSVPGSASDGVRIDPHSSTVRFGEKWKVGATRNAHADAFGIDYNMLGAQFDNKEVLGVYNVGGFEFSRVRGWVDVNGDYGSMLSVSSWDGEPIFVGTGSKGKGIASWGKQPVSVYSEAGFEANGLRTTSNATTVNGARFGQPGDASANFVNDETAAKKFMIYGNKSEDGKTKRVGVAEALDVYGDVQAVDWAAGQNIYGRDHVTAGDWAAWMRSDGAIQGRTVDATEMAAADTVVGRAAVVAGDNKAYMRSDGSVGADSVTAQTFDASAAVRCGKAFMSSEGEISGTSVSISGALGVGGALNASVIASSSNVVAPGISSKSGSSDWFRVNAENASSAGSAIFGAAAVSRGLSVGALDSTVPEGVVRATSNLCVNAACLSEEDVKRLTAPVQKLCINNTCLTESELQRVIASLNAPAPAPTVTAPPAS